MNNAKECQYKNTYQWNKRRIEEKNFFCDNPVHAFYKAILTYNMSVIHLIFRLTGFLVFLTPLEDVEECGTFSDQFKMRVRELGYSYRPPTVEVEKVNSVYSLCAIVKNVEAAKYCLETLKIPLTKRDFFVALTRGTAELLQQYLTVFSVESLDKCFRNRKKDILGNPISYLFRVYPTDDYVVWARGYRAFKMLKLLVEKGFSVTTNGFKKSKKWTIVFAILHVDDPEEPYIADLVLTKHNIPPNITNGSDYSLMDSVAKPGFFQHKKITLLLKKGFNMLQKRTKGIVFSLFVVFIYTIKKNS